MKQEDIHDNNTILSWKFSTQSLSNVKPKTWRPIWKTLFKGKYEPVRNYNEGHVILGWWEMETFEDVKVKTGSAWLIDYDYW